MPLNATLTLTTSWPVQQVPFFHNLSFREVKKLQIQQGKIPEFLRIAHMMKTWNHLMTEVPEWDLATPRSSSRADQTACLIRCSRAHGSSCRVGLTIGIREEACHSLANSAVCRHRSNTRDPPDTPVWGTYLTASTQMAVRFLVTGNFPSMTFSTCRT